MSSVTYRSENIKPVKLNVVGVKWTSNANTEYKVYKIAHAATKEKADERTKISAIEQSSSLKSLNNLIDNFEANASGMLENKLVAYGITKGNKKIIELTPIKATQAVEGGRSIYIKMTIHHAPVNSTPPSVVIRINGPKSTANKEFLEEFTKKAFHELKNIGWI